VKDRAWRRKEKSVPLYQDGLKREGRGERAPSRRSLTAVSRRRSVGERVACAGKKEELTCSPPTPNGRGQMGEFLRISSTDIGDHVKRKEEEELTIKNVCPGRYERASYRRKNITGREEGRSVVSEGIAAGFPKKHRDPFYAEESSSRENEQGEVKCPALGATKYQKKNRRCGEEKRNTSIIVINDERG